MRKLISVFILLCVVSACMGLIFAPIKLNVEEFVQHQSFKEQMMGKDKLLHFGASFLITGSGYMYGRSNGFSNHESQIIGIGLGLTIGLAKEYYDTKKKNPTGWSWYDLLADGAGIISAATLMEVGNEN